jgi:hypothetical protein
VTAMIPPELMLAVTPPAATFAEMLAPAVWLSLLAVLGALAVLIAVAGARPDARPIVSPLRLPRLRSALPTHERRAAA